MKIQYWVSLFTLLLFSSCVSTLEDKSLSEEYYVIGNSYFELEEFSKAKESYIKSIEYAVNNRSLFNLVRINIMEKEFTSAITNIEILYAQDKENIKTKKLRAYLYYIEGKLSKALSLYESVFKSGDTSYDVFLNILKIMYQLDSFELAKDHLQYMENYDSDNKIVDSLFIAGSIYQKIGDDIKAESYFSKYIELEGKNLFVYKNLYDYYLSLDNTIKALSILDFIISNSSGEELALYTFKKARILLVNESNYSEGFDLLEDSLEMGYNDSLEAEALLREPELIELDKIKTLFVTNNILE